MYSAKFAFIAGVNGDPTRQKLLHEAARHFARHGYDGASLRRISEGVGIRAASIYNHFPDGKEELYEHIMSAIAEMLLDRIVNRYGRNVGLSAEDAIVQLGAAFWDFCEEHPDYATLLIREMFDNREPDVGALMGRAPEIIEASLGYIENAQASGELPKFDAEAFILWSASYLLSYHGAPGLRTQVQRKAWSKELARDNFISMLRKLLRTAD